MFYGQVTASCAQGTGNVHPLRNGPILFQTPSPSIVASFIIVANEFPSAGS
jgi:hypothetical protein